MQHHKHCLLQTIESVVVALDGELLVISGRNWGSKPASKDWSLDHILRLDGTGKALTCNCVVEFYSVHSLGCILVKSHGHWGRPNLVINVVNLIIYGEVAPYWNGRKHFNYKVSPVVLIFPKHPYFKSLLTYESWVSDYDFEPWKGDDFFVVGRHPRDLNRILESCLNQCHPWQTCGNRGIYVFVSQDEREIAVVVVKPIKLDNK